ncbi:head-tail adaptor [Neorhizobium sp. R1-B]|uniref:head-tail adaptor protein n=1 Tax=Neorhizobium sp. R1-B TaxID=2485162 RepID=UPI001064C8D2|nr:head-tail adaptor protein [Neorhizobium sp. R1-B]TDX72603.1 head-tail adaptor [Neorhizobium sp. R1-B]
MALGAGSLKAKIVIQRASATPNEFNEQVETWADLYTCRARREDSSSGEKEAAGQVGAFLMARFAIRRSIEADQIRFTDRLVHEDGIWSIKEIKRLKEAPDMFLEITAIRDADLGDEG